MTKIAYVKHPVSREQKQAIRAEGFTIVDARFAPKDAEIIDPRAEQGSEPTKLDDKPLTIPQVKELLAEKGIDIPAGVTKRDDLLALLTDGEQ